MMKPLHNNLLEMFGSREAAYEQLQLDQANTTRHFNWYAGISGGALIGSAVAGAGTWGWPLLSLGVLFGFIAMRHWIDASNRNFLMHSLDLTEPQRLRPQDE